MADERFRKEFPQSKSGMPAHSERGHPLGSRPIFSERGNEQQVPSGNETKAGGSSSGSCTGITGAVKAAVHWLSPPPAATSREGNSIREIVETVVFVVVLVLLLKTFAAEAFVIPTGSMATTLWGNQEYVDCPKCGYHFPVNCSDQVKRDSPMEVVGCTCPNCRYPIDFAKEGIEPKCNTGDRVLVAKSLYDTGLAAPERFNVVVFKYPGSANDDGHDGPQKNFEPMNYIKRLIGLGGETIGIYYGKLYVWKPEKGAPQYHDSDVQDIRAHHNFHTVKGTRVEDTELDLWRLRYMHVDEAKKILEALVKNPQGQETNRLKTFEIIRKPPGKLLAMRRLVYDNDHPASDLKGTGWARWADSDKGSGWAADDRHGFRHEVAAGNRIDWLRYRHILRQGPQTADAPEPELITDFIGYNTKKEALGEAQFPIYSQSFPHNWVGDLMLECQVTIDKPDGELILELSKGVDRFRARWDLSSGLCSLFRVTDGMETALPESRARPTGLKKKGTYLVRFANIDERLVVWVDKSLPFGDGVNYSPPRQRGPFENDLQPASIGVRHAAVQIHQLKLWRDTYYTHDPGRADAGVIDDIVRSGNEVESYAEKRQRLHQILSDPSQWEPLRDLPGKTMYVQPDHFLCLGDNSPESSDSRAWGLVPKRLMLGRALMVYYPFKFPYWPLSNPVNRIGPIK